MIQAHWESFKTTVSSVWGAVGPLVGVLIGAYLAKRWQRNQWVADNKRSEYRKLLTTMTRTFTGIVKLRGPGVALGPTEQRAIFNLESQSFVVIRDRIFIAEEIKSMNLLQRWNEALHNYDHTLDADAFARAFGLIANDLQKSAANIIRERKWFG